MTTCHTVHMTTKLASQFSFMDQNIYMNTVTILYEKYQTLVHKQYFLMDAYSTFQNSGSCKHLRDTHAQTQL